MTPPITYAVHGEGTSPRFARAFALGCKGVVCYGATLQPGSVAMFGSPQRWAMLQEAFRQTRTIYYGDHAFFGRGQYYRIARNAYQVDGTAPATPERFSRFNRPVQSWRTSGAHILVCPQSAVYFGLFGIDVDAWIASVVNTLKPHTDREIRVRWKRDDTPISEDLKDAWAVVVFSSNAAVDALIAGVPVFVLADFAATRRMGLSDLSEIESPICPDGRDPFLWALADNQWTLAEIEQGIAWQALTTQERRRAA